MLLQVILDHLTGVLGEPNEISWSRQESCAASAAPGQPRKDLRAVGPQGEAALVDSRSSSDRDVSPMVQRWPDGVMAAAVTAPTKGPAGEVDHVVDPAGRVIKTLPDGAP
jgi:hypothetical protein